MRIGLQACIATAFFIAACDDKKNPPPAPAPAETASTTLSASTPNGGKLPEFNPEQTRLFQPIPEGVEKPTMDDATKLGQQLYWDARLSGNGKYACVTCHDFSKAGTDGLAVASGPKKPELPRATPTIYNAGGSFAQGWDARAGTIEEFALPHTLDPSIMDAGDAKKLVEVLNSIPAYVAAFKKAFPDEKAITGDLYAKAIGEFTKKLFARSRWDRYLGGDKSQLKDDELIGFAMFVEAGCTSCHQGKYVGATQTQKLGMARPWPPPQGSDPGRFAFSKQEMDRGMYKVPTLRNITRTGPYLHDGSIASLTEMTKLMAHHQVGKDLTDEQAKAVDKFLATLEGDPPAELTAKPALPPGGPKTPKPAASN
jgi:cytochrome c peroxidase